MIVDFNAHFGELPDLDALFTEEDLRVTALAAGIGGVVCTDTGSALGAHRTCVSGIDVRFDGLHVLHTTGTPALYGSWTTTGAIVYPTYSPLELGSMSFESVLAAASRSRQVLHVCLRLRDPRVMPQLVPSANAIASLSRVAPRWPQVRFVVSGAVLGEVSGAPDLFRLPNVWLETSHLQHPMNSLRKVVDLLGAERVVFGTNAPYFYPEVAVFRLRHTTMTDLERRLIASENAHDLLREARH